MHTIKKIFACFYYYVLQTPLRKMARWSTRIEKGCLGYCCYGCEKCYKWKCCVRTPGKTPYRKFRRGKFRD